MRLLAIFRRHMGIRYSVPICRRWRRSCTLNLHCILVLKTHTRHLHLGRDKRLVNDLGLLAMWIQVALVQPVDDDTIEMWRTKGLGVWLSELCVADGTSRATQP